MGIKGELLKRTFYNKITKNERKHQSYNQLAGMLIFRVFASEVYAVCKYAKDKTCFVRFFQNVLAKATNTLGHIRSSGSTPKSIKTRPPYHSSQDSGENMANFRPRIEWQIEDSKIEVQNLLVFGLYLNHEKHRRGLPCSSGARSPRRAQSAIQKKQKGDRCLPKIN
ncbi:hypothetical protein [Prevotella sp. S7-1-8]|uniref:hypothetical protein n=1 Tax=Prevotella sp. S7-1-8 TaxID=1284775 RepID=UPI0005664D1A|nr:hypothetical protein [Prevotella sp. S7-1-8]